MIDRRTLLAGTAAGLLLRPRQAAAAPVSLRIVGLRVFIAVTVNGRAAEALLDSAAETSVIDRAFADRLGLTGGRPVIAEGTGTATISGRLVAGVELGAAGLLLRPATVAVIDLAEVATRVTSGPLDLILGRELFDAARLRIDLRAATLEIADDRRPAGTRLPLSTREGVETLPVIVEGWPAAARFDTGNSGRVLIGATYARRRGLLRDGRRTGTVGGGGIGGATWQTSFTLRRLDLAGRRFDAVEAAIDDSPAAADVNVGVAVLRDFGIVTDFARRAVWLDPH